MVGIMAVAASADQQRTRSPGFALHLEMVGLTINRWMALAFIGILLLCGVTAAQAQGLGVPKASLSSEGVSSAAEQIFAAAKPALLQVRTLVASTGRQSVLGSGFIVAPGGVAITNYHVVSEFALHPDIYRLDYVGGDGISGKVQLLAIDIADDLALIRIDHDPGHLLSFDSRINSGPTPKGESLYALGNPQDLGFTIVEGTNSGPVDRSYNERIHFTGAINPGMSGGPVLSADGKVIGVNVARQLDSQLVSFLIPGRFAAALFNDAAKRPPSADIKAEIDRQLIKRQAALYGGGTSLAFHLASFGPYQAPELAASWSTCWSQTNEDAIPKPRANVSTTFCDGDTGMFVAEDLSTGMVWESQTYVRSVDLNAFQFASFLSTKNQLRMERSPRTWLTAQRCQDEYLAAEPHSGRPPLRAIWCAQAYRQFEGLYDVGVMTVTQNKSQEALISRLVMRGISYDNGMEQAKRFIEGIRWKK